MSKKSLSAQNATRKIKMVILGSRPCMGQTSLAFNIATNMFMKQDIAVLIFSVFEDVEEINARILSSEAMVDFDKIRKGKFICNSLAYTR